MKLYKTLKTNDIVDIGGAGILLTLCASDGYIYIVSEGLKEPEWIEVSQAEFEAVGGILPDVNQTTLEEVKENQLVLMEAVADLYEAILGGGS